MVAGGCTRPTRVRPACAVARTGTNNAADAALIALAPEMANVMLKLKAALTLDQEHTESCQMLTALLTDAMCEATELVDRLVAATAKIKH
mgnify:CR=1 FL=1